MTDRYVVAGHPVAHSKSPRIHSLFAAQTGQTLHYGRLLCPLDGFAETLHAFARSTQEDDLHGPARGCNVTVPFKFEAFNLTTRHTERAGLAQAANTLRFDADGWLADNTDGVGLVRDIEHNAQTALKGRRLLLVGAGGAAAGALGALIAASPSELVLVNRTPDKAHALVQSHQAWAEQHHVRLRGQGLVDCGRAFDVVINATASSLQGGPPPVAIDVLRPGSLALDMMYGPAAEGFLMWAQQHGATARDGLGMLVEQAAEAFHLWRGVRPDTAPVLDTLRQSQTP